MPFSFVNFNSFIKSIKHHSLLWPPLWRKMVQRPWPHLWWLSEQNSGESAAASLGVSSELPIADCIFQRYNSCNNISHPIFSYVWPWQPSRLVVCSISPALEPWQIFAIASTIPVKMMPYDFSGRSLKCHALLACPLGRILALRIQPPCNEKAQATWRDHMEMSQPTDPRWLWTVPALERPQTLWSRDKLFSGVLKSQTYKIHECNKMAVICHQVLGWIIIQIWMTEHCPCLLSSWDSLESWTQKHYFNYLSGPI